MKQKDKHIPFKTVRDNGWRRYQTTSRKTFSKKEKYAARDSKHTEGSWF